jgi:hypothetical protein
MVCKIMLSISDILIYSINKLLTMMPVSKVIKQRDVSIEAPGFRVPIIVSDIPHHAIELFDSRLNNNSMLLSL